MLGVWWGQKAAEGLGAGVDKGNIRNEVTPGLSPIVQRCAAAADHTKEWTEIMSPPSPSARMKGKVAQQCCLVQTRGRGGGGRGEDAEVLFGRLGND